MKAPSMQDTGVDFTFQTEADEDFDVEAFIDGVRVGYAWGIKTGDRLLLSDLRVQPHSPVAYSRLPKFLRPRPKPLRGRGIGRELLRRFLGEADAIDVREIWGSVTLVDLRETPFLLDLYQKHGFIISEPDAECVPQAVKKIIRRLPRDPRHA
jgi:hypothetical protein